MYFRNSSVDASLKHTAFAAMMWTSGPPCISGKTARLRSFANTSRHSTTPLLGPRNLFLAFELDGPRISARSDDNHLRPLAARQRFEFLIVDDFCVLSNSIEHDAVVFSGEIQRMAVGEMSAVRQIHSKNGVSGLKHRQIY